MKTQKEIKLETITQHRNEIVEGIKEIIKGSDVTLKQAMEKFLGARCGKSSNDISIVKCYGYQAVQALSDKVGNKVNKYNNRQHFMSDHAKRLYL